MDSKKKKKSNKKIRKRIYLCGKLCFWQVALCPWGKVHVLSSTGALHKRAGGQGKEELRFHWTLFPAWASSPREKREWWGNSQWATHSSGSLATSLSPHGWLPCYLKPVWNGQPFHVILFYLSLPICFSCISSRGYLSSYCLNLGGKKGSAQLSPPELSW